MIENILDSLGQLEAALGTHAAEIEPYSAEWYDRRSLLQQRTDLQQALKVELLAQRRPALQFLFEEPVVDNTVPADLMGRALIRLQDAITALGQALEVGRRTRGMIQFRVQDRTRLRLAALAYGSIGVVLEGELEPTQQPLLRDEVELGLLERCVVELLDILGTAANPSEQSEAELVDRFARLGERALGRLQDFSTELAEEGVSFKVVFNAPQIPERALALDRTQVRALSGLLGEIDTDEDLLELDGTLEGARMLRDTFDFQAEDGRVFTGRVSEQAHDQMPTYFHRRCRARIQATKVTSRLGTHETTTYVLVDLSDA